MTEIEIVGLMKEAGAFGTLVYVILRHLIPAIDRHGDAVKTLRASNDARHATTQRAVAEGACRAPGSTRNGSPVLPVLLALLAACLALGGCSSVHDSAVMFRDDLKAVRNLSTPRKSVRGSDYDRAWNALEAHAAELAARTE